MDEIIKWFEQLSWLTNFIGLLTPILGIIAWLKIKERLDSYRKNKNKVDRFSLYKKMNDDDYKTWQLSLFEKLYETSEFVCLYSKKYPAIIIRTLPIFNYPFKNLIILKSNDLNDVPINRIQKKYLRFIGDSVKRPKMPGFSLEKIDIDDKGNIFKVHANLTNYEQNLITSHILEWELYLFYSKNKNIDPNSEILKKLSFRRKYHEGKTSFEAITSSNKTFPLLSIQALIVFKDHTTTKEWKAVLAKRNKDVAIKPNLWQFQPAGGFEVYGKEDDYSKINIDTNFDVTMAFFREYAEELYNVKDFEFCNDSREPNSSILNEPHVSLLKKLIENNKASMEFLGAINELTTLRTELSFLIIIDDEEFCKLPITGSKESVSIFTPTLNQLKTILIEENIHSSSAGLFQLALENKKFRECFNEQN